MADKSFGVEQVDIFGSGTPTIQSPNDLNINAVNVAISTNVSVGAALTVGAGLNVTGVSTFNGYLNAASRLYFDENTGTKYMFGSGVDLLTTISSEGDWKLTLNASGGTGGNFIVEKSSGNSLLEAKGTGAVDITGDLNVTGISTFNDNVLLGDSDIFGLGDAGFNGGVPDLRFFHNGSSSNIINTTGHFFISQSHATDGLYLKGPLIVLRDPNNNDIISGTASGVTINPTAGGVTLKHNGNQTKLETTTTGIDVTGGITVNGSALSIDPSTSDIQVTYEITNQTSFSYYRFAGNGVDSSADNPELLLERGQKYRFINNSGGSHPFQIQTTGGSAYNTGVTNNNASSGNIDFAVRWDAPSILKYQCTNHGSMQGNIYIIGGSRGILTSASTLSGSSNSFNGIPSWATKIIVVFYQMSTDTTSARALVRLRNSNGTISSGYDSYSVDEDGSESADDIQNSTGFVIETQSSGHTYNGTMIIEKIDNTKYVSSYSAVRTATGALGTYQQISGNGRLLIASGGIVTGVSLDMSSGNFDSNPSTNYATIYYE